MSKDRSGGRGYLGFSTGSGGPPGGPCPGLSENWVEFLESPQAKEKVSFGVLNLEKAELIVGIDGEVYELRPKKIVRIPLANALILELRGLGKILWTPEDAILFKMRVKGIDPDTIRATHDDGTILPRDGREAVHLEYYNAIDPTVLKGGIVQTSHSGVILSCKRWRLRFINNPYDLLISEVIYCENYTSIEPAKRLVELAAELGFKEWELEASITGYFHYKCENGHIIHIPKVQGGWLNPYIQQQNSRNSAKALAKKLIQLNREAKVLERDSRTGELRLLKRNNLYLIPMELTYPHELNDYFLKLLAENPVRFYRMRERAVYLFLRKVLEYEFGEYAKFSDFINWLNHHDWKTEDPTKPHFHEHLDLLNVLFDWRGSKDYRKLYEAINKHLTPTVKDIAEYTGWSVSTVKRKISFFRGMGLIGYSKRGRFFTAIDAPLPTPLIRFNPFRFTAEEVKKDEKRLKAYQRFWKEAIEEVFGVKLDKEPVVHLPDKVISLENYHQLVHRLSYCSRKPIVDLNNYFNAHPNADIDLGWLKHLLTFENKRKPNKIAKRLSEYVGIEFLATLQNRLSRLRKKYEGELYELERVGYELAKKERELRVLGRSLSGAIVRKRLEIEIRRLRSKREKLLKVLEPLFELEKRVRVVSESLSVKPVCPLCGSKMDEVEEEVSDDCSILYFDPVAKRFCLLEGNRVDYG